MVDALCLAILVASATYAICYAWLRSSLFASMRARLEAKVDDYLLRYDVDSSLPWHVRLVELLLCPACLGYHVAFWLGVFAITTWVLDLKILALLLVVPAAAGFYLAMWRIFMDADPLRELASYQQEDAGAEPVELPEEGEPQQGEEE